MSYADWVENGTQEYTVKAVSVLGLASEESTKATVNFYVFTGSIYISEDFVIPAGEECLLLPGAKLTFQSGARLIVRGTLTAVGKADQTIKILAYQQSGSFILVEAGGIFNAAQIIVIQPGGVGFCIQNYGKLNLSDSYISSALGSGIWLQSQQDCTLAGNTIVAQNEDLLIDGSGSAAITVTKNTISSSLGNAVHIKNNAQNTICVQGNTVTQVNGAVLNVAEFGSFANITVSGNRLWSASTVKVNGQTLTGTYVLGRHTILNGSGSNYWANKNETVGSMAVTPLWMEEQGSAKYAYIQYISGGKTKRGYVSMSAVYCSSGGITKYLMGNGIRYTNRADVQVYPTPAAADSIGLISLNYPVTVLLADGNYYFVEYKISATGVLKRGYVAKSVFSVTAAPVQVTITRKPADNKILLHQNCQLGVSISPAHADNRVTWSSSNPNVAFVDGGGKVLALQAGTAVITVRSTADAAKTDSFTCRYTHPE